MKTNAQLAAKLLRNAAEFFRSVGEQNPAMTDDMEQNARRCLEICDRGYVLDQGTNAYTGTGQQLLDDPKVVSLYLGTLMGS